MVASAALRLMGGWSQDLLAFPSQLSSAQMPEEVVEEAQEGGGVGGGGEGVLLFSLSVQ